MRLPPALPPEDYDTPGLPRLSAVREWKARILFGAPEDVDAGRKGEVGYVMVSLKDDTVIPIARPDEHRRGYATLQDMAKRWEVSPRDYVPIFRHGPVYVDAAHQLPDLLAAVRKWRDAGGPDLAVQCRIRGEEQVLSMDDFLKVGGMAEPRRGSLLPVGERLVAHLERLAQAIRNARGGLQAGKTKVAFDQADRLAAMLGSYWNVGAVAVRAWFDREGFRYPMDALRADLAAWRATDDVAALDTAVFGFGDGWRGIKRSIHDGVREALRDPSVWYAADLRSVFGDLDYAFDRLGRIGALPDEISNDPNGEQHPMERKITWDDICRDILDDAAAKLLAEEASDPDRAVSFAMDYWTGGGLMTDDDIEGLGLDGVTPKNFGEVFEEKVLAAVRADARFAGFEGRYLDPALRDAPTGPRP